MYGYNLQFLMLFKQCMYVCVCEVMCVCAPVYCSKERGYSVSNFCKFAQTEVIFSAWAGGGSLTQRVSSSQQIPGMQNQRKQVNESLWNFQQLRSSDPQMKKR